MTRYAQETSVPVAKSRAELEQVITRSLLLGSGS